MKKTDKSYQEKQKAQDHFILISTELLIKNKHTPKTTKNPQKQTYHMLLTAT